MTNYVCRGCTRTVDPDDEPSPGEPTRCPDCHQRAEIEFSEWMRGAW